MNDATPQVPNRSALATIIVACAVVFLHVSCEKTPANDAAKATVVDDIVRENADIVASFPGHRGSEDLVRKLIAAQPVLDGGTVSEGYRDLLVRFRDSRVGVRLLLEAARLLRESGPGPEEALYHDILAKIPDSRVGVAAEDCALENLARQNEAAFEARSAELVAKGGALGVVALLRRAEFDFRKGERKKAAREYLEFWSKYPEKVASLNLAVQAAGAVRAAGYVLEGDVLEASNRPESIATYILSQVTAPDTGNASPRPDFLQHYFTLAPELGAMMGLPPVETADGIAGCEMLARMARLSIEELNPPLALELHDRLCELLGSAKDVSGIDPASAEFLRLACTVNTKKLIQMFMGEMVYGSERHPAGRRKFDEVPRITGVLVNSSLELWSKSNPDVQPARAAEVYEQYASLLDESTNSREAGKLLREFTRRFPDDDNAPRILFVSAGYFSKATDFESAISVCEDIRAKYSDSPEASTARLRQVIYLYDSKQFEEAYIRGQEFIEIEPLEPRKASLLFLAGLSAAKLDAMEDATELMSRLLQEYPTQDAAARALYWLATRKLAQQEYAAAKDYFDQLRERFPEHELTAQAKNLPSLSGLRSGP